MTDERGFGELNRRRFMAAAIGAPAALSAGAEANGAARAAAAPGRTAYTGDVIDGKKVVSFLDVEDLEPGRKHLLYFRGVESPGGHHWRVSVAVARGVRPGKRVALVSGVHGDEMTSIRAVQRVMEGLDPAAMSGTVLAAFDVSRPAIEGMQRRWPNSGRGIDLIDINREWPGNENGLTASSRHAAMLFDRLLRPNADYALDFHTGPTGSDVAAFLLARMDLPEVRAMADMFPVEQIYDNPGAAGLLAEAFIDAGIPALTPEIGKPRAFDPDMITAFVEGTMNVLKLHGIVADPIGRTGKNSGVFIASLDHGVLAAHGGFVELLVRLNDNVTAGQGVAVQRNAFGEVIAEYAAGVTGKVAGLRTDATAEPGDMLVYIFHNPDQSGEAVRNDPIPE